MGVAIGEAFPTGGPVPMDRMVGRDEAIRALVTRLNERIGVTIVGPRRIGKTSVGNAICDTLAASHVVVRVEVPEGGDSVQLRYRLWAACQGASLKDEARLAFNTLLPTIKQWFATEGVPLDLEKAEDLDPVTAPWRSILMLPIGVAKARGKPLLLFLDELQRAVDYADATEVLGDLVDLYGARTPEAVVLVDGSSERAVDELLGQPHHLAKIAPGESLAERVPLTTWRPVLRERFVGLGLAIDEDALERILAWSDGRPFATAAACEAAALTARSALADRVTMFDAERGIDRARRRLEEDDA